MSINIITYDDNEARVYFSKTNPSGRTSADYIIATPPNEYNDPASINIPATGNLQLEDVPKLIEAIKLAAKIAERNLLKGN